MVAFLILSHRFFLPLFSDVGDSPSDHAQEDIDSEVYPSEDGEYM